MNISTVPPATGVQVDPNWLMQGRVFAPSCTNGDGCVLCIQVRHKSWPEHHFHTGYSRIIPELGLEIALALLTPYDIKLARESMNDDEEEDDVPYLYMVRLIQPPEAIAFLTVTGLTTVVQLQDIGNVFGVVKGCSDCSEATLVPDLITTPTLPSDKSMDAMMEIRGKDIDH